jgi:hypothetical protein
MTRHEWMARNMGGAESCVRNARRMLAAGHASAAILIALDRALELLEEPFQPLQSVCPECDGAGRAYYERVPNHPSGRMSKLPCNTCGGSGEAAV